MKPVYIALFHGRSRPDEELDDWGRDGPVIGPVHLTWTYDNLKLHSPDPMVGDFEFLPVDEELVRYDGFWYGDFEVLVEGDEHLVTGRNRGGREIHDFATFQQRLQSATPGTERRRK